MAKGKKKSEVVYIRPNWFEKTLTFPDYSYEDITIWSKYLEGYKKVRITIEEVKEAI